MISAPSVVSIGRILSYSDVRYLSLVRPEPGIVQLFNGIFHIFMAQELHNTGSVFVHIGEANVARLPHMVLQILPRAGRGQPRNHDTELGSPSRGTTIAPITSATPTALTVAPATAVTSWSTSAGELHSQSITIVVVPIAGLYCIISITSIFKFYKSKWRPAAVFQVNEGNFAELVEQILNVLGAYIRGKVSDVDSALVATVRHDFLMMDAS